MKKLILFIFFLSVPAIALAVDVAIGIDCLVPQAEYFGSVVGNTEAEFNAIRWNDTRPKPTWQDLVNNEAQCNQDYSDYELERKRTFAKDEITNQMLIRALVRVIVEEFNRNRTWHSRPSISKDDVIRAIKDELDTMNQ